MRKLILAVAALALVGAPAFAAAKKAANNTTAAAAAPAKAAPKYDCTKKGNASKAACKTAAAPAAAPVAPAKPAPAAMPAPAAKPAPAATPAPAAKPAAAVPAKAASTTGGSKMKACASQWDAMSADQKATYSTQAKGQTGKSGKALSGYNVFSKTCLKK